MSITKFSKVVYVGLSRILNLIFSMTKKPTPPPKPWGRGLWHNVKPAGVIERRKLSLSDGRMWVSVMANILKESVDIMSEILGPLFLTDRQLTTPNEIGPGLSQYTRTFSTNLAQNKLYLKTLQALSTGVLQKAFSCRYRWKMNHHQ